MLILDVKTRWSSTHQMLSHALQYQTFINEFVDVHHDLHDWDAIATVSDWLLNFCSATSQMSMTSKPMLSSTHSTFRGLQRSLKDKLKQLPQDAPPELIEGLTQAHRKLSDYYYKYDNSPFYIWAAHMYYFHLLSLRYPRGSAVAVERIFSGGRDTISLCRACLKPETIRVLMLYKNRLRLKRKVLEDALNTTIDV
ncbi:hypothetical protein BDP27DRAFT_1382743 [Rhodocollybia butyracea]|uniref:HAT C-terminal dimerisation domain-containing protein n=1 Tax=Rhodocollybia butyracea TaxID=206335 RepID=A0A9P5PWX3_9AGAR|nr:hypothetical protein BDP27DRAFT_1382743 [Rhodocollybia butyracea]